MSCGWRHPPHTQSTWPWPQESHTEGGTAQDLSVPWEPPRVWAKAAAEGMYPRGTWRLLSSQPVCHRQGHSGALLSPPQWPVPGLGTRRWTPVRVGHTDISAARSRDPREGQKDRGGRARLRPGACDCPRAHAHPARGAGDHQHPGQQHIHPQRRPVPLPRGVAILCSGCPAHPCQLLLATLLPQLT